MVLVGVKRLILLKIKNRHSVNPADIQAESEPPKERDNMDQDSPKKEKVKAVSSPSSVDLGSSSSSKYSSIPRQDKGCECPEPKWKPGQKCGNDDRGKIIRLRGRVVG